jgi:predicted N-acetyltransferase YhbS
MHDALKNTFLGVIATDTRDGQIVGMTRVFGDGCYFMLWDVIVRPSHQGQKIGTALVEGALRALRERVHPGAFVGLFTSRSGFYQRMGFKEGRGMQLALLKRDCRTFQTPDSGLLHVGLYRLTAHATNRSV